MSILNLQNIIVKNNPSNFTEPIVFHIAFETLEEIQREIEWKFIYIGCVSDSNHDQVLDCFSMGPLQKGVMQFDVEVDPPDASRIPNKQDLLGVTALIVTVSYNEKEFLRVGYYVYNYYTDQELLDQPPKNPILEKITRNILSDKPRITTFDIFKQGQEEDKNFEEIRKKLMLTMKQSSSLGKVNQQLNKHRSKEEEKFEEIVESDQDEETQKEQQQSEQGNQNSNKESNTNDEEGLQNDDQFVVQDDIRHEEMSKQQLIQKNLQENIEDTSQQQQQDKLIMQRQYTFGNEQMTMKRQYSNQDTQETSNSNNKLTNNNMQELQKIKGNPSYQPIKEKLVPFEKGNEKQTNE